MIEVESFSLYRILKDTNLELFSKVKEDYFTGYNLFLYKKLNNYYKANKKLPSMDEFEGLSLTEVVKNYYQSNIKVPDYEVLIVDSGFLLRQLEDNYIKRNVLNNLEDLLNNYETLEASEVRESVDSLALDLNSSATNKEEFFDVSELDTFAEDESFILYPTGISNEFDAVNGGFALQEEVLLGGRRGSGKSIITLNALRARFEMGHTVILFSIEMRYREQYSRLMSMVSGVPFLSIYKNEVTQEDQVRLAEARVKFWYKDTPEARDLIKKVQNDRNFKEFDQLCKKLEQKDNRFIIIDQIGLELSKINYYLRMVSEKYPNFTMVGVDYLNIVKIEDRLNWQSQILISDNLKEYARTYNVTLMSPYQMDADGEARFAKGILDSADKSLIFMPSEQEEQQKEAGQLSELKVYTAKIRNGRPISFSIWIDWSIVRVRPEGRMVNEQLLPGEKYGSDSAPTPLIDKSGAMDLIPE
jgi:replicative DNA helicase